MRVERRARPSRQFVERVHSLGITAEVEGEFPPNDQLLQKFVRDQTMLGRILLYRDSDFESGDVPKVQIRAELGCRVRRRLVLISRISVEPLRKESAKQAKPVRPSTGRLAARRRSFPSP